MALSVARLVSAILSGWRTDPDSKFAPGSTLAPGAGTGIPATNVEAQAWYEAKAIIEEIEDNLDTVSGADHAGLTNLAWGSSGHTGTANRIAGFDGAGAATHYQIGVDVQAYDADLTGLGGLADGVACRVAGTWTNKTGTDERLVRWDGTTGLQSSDVGLTDDSTLAWKESGLIRAHNNGTLKLQSYDLGGGTWADMVTLTSGSAGVNLSGTGTTIGGQYPYRVGGTDVSVADGGTGASTAADARTNLCVLQGMIAKIPSNVTMTNATLASTGCTLTIGANETWMFLMTFESNVNATDNLKYQLQTTGTAFAGYGGTQNAAVTRYTEASVVVVTQSANPQQYTAIGHVLGGASGGTVTLYVAKNGTSGGNGTVYAGGSIVAWKLP